MVLAVLWEIYSSQLTVTGSTSVMLTVPVNINSQNYKTGISIWTLQSPDYNRNLYRLQHVI